MARDLHHGQKAEEIRPEKTEPVVRVKQPSKRQLNAALRHAVRVKDNRTYEEADKCQ